MTDVKPQVQVADNPGQSRFEAFVNGELAGYTTYHSRGESLVFPHTVVEPKWGGKGVGAALVAGALDATVAAGHSIIPQCPFVVGFIKRNPRYAEHVHPDYRAAVAP